METWNTTANRLKECDFPYWAWSRLSDALGALPEESRVSASQIIEACGLHVALPAMAAFDGCDEQLRAFGIECCERARRYYFEAFGSIPAHLEESRVLRVSLETPAWRFADSAARAAANAASRAAAGRISDVACEAERRWQTEEFRRMVAAR